jgi:hypothetical protein
MARLIYPPGHPPFPAGGGPDLPFSPLPESREGEGLGSTARPQSAESVGIESAVALLSSSSSPCPCRVRRTPTLGRAVSSPPSRATRPRRRRSRRRPEASRRGEPGGRVLGGKGVVGAWRRGRRGRGRRSRAESVKAADGARRRRHFSGPTDRALAVYQQLGSSSSIGSSTDLTKKGMPGFFRVCATTPRRARTPRGSSPTGFKRIALVRRNEYADGLAREVKRQAEPAVESDQGRVPTFARASRRSRQLAPTRLLHGDYPDEWCSSTPSPACDDPSQRRQP